MLHQVRARIRFFLFILTLSLFSSLTLLWLLSGSPVQAAVNCAGSSWSVGNEADLNAAIACYNAKTSRGTYRITLTQDIDLTASTSQIDNATANVKLVVNGNGYTVDGQDISGVRPFDIAIATQVTLQNITITRGNPWQNGGGILNAGRLTVRDSTLSDNSGDLGGGIYNFDNGRVSVIDSTLSDNSADIGGGISTYLGSVTVTDSTLSDNSAEFGGGIYNGESQVTITDSPLSNNSASDDGGGVYNFGRLTVRNSTLSNNSASDDGGGIFNFDKGRVTLKNSTLSNNSAGDDGGGILNFDSGEVAITGSTFNNNSAGDDGGGILNSKNGEVTITGSIFNNNSAKDGGGIFNFDNSSITDNGSTFSDNSATDGAGIFNNAKLNVRNSIFSSNTANKDGGGIFNANNGNVTVTGSTFSANSTIGFGGGINNLGSLIVTSSTFTQNLASNGGGITNSFNGSVSVTGSTLNGNSVSDQGGGIFNNGDTLSVTDSTLSGNSADFQGGGIFNSDSNATVMRSTLSDNSANAGSVPDGGGGSIGNTTTAILALTASIVANSPNGGDCFNSATITDGGYNLVEDNSCGFTGGRDPNLGPLQDNGGATFTHALLAGSPAIDQIPTSAAACTTGTLDQRGLPRANGASQGGTACDIGAFEVQNLREIIVSGNGQEIAAGDPSPSLTDHTDFGQIVVGSSLTRTFTISNTGIAPLTVSSASLTGPHVNDFTLTPPSTTIASNSSTTFTIQFAPPLTGLRVATITLINDDPDENPYTFAIQGTGTAPEMVVLGNGQEIAAGDPNPRLTNHTDFGQIVVGGSLTRTFTISNSGTATLTVSSLSLTGPHASDFSLTPLSSSLIAPNSSSIFTVQFAPTLTSTRIATVTLSNNDSDENSYTFAIQGTGTVPEIAVLGNGQEITAGDPSPTPTDHTDFGQVVVRNHLTHTFTISNRGTASLTVSSVDITGPHASDFRLIPPASSSIAPSSSTTFTVTFAPLLAGPRVATVTLAHDDNNKNPYTFAIQGIGNAPKIVVLGNGQEIVAGDTYPTLIDHTDFGRVAENNSLIRTFTISNSGTSLLSVSSVAITGPHASEFSLTPPTSSSIAPNSSVTFTIQFAPRLIGLHVATVSLVNDDLDENPYTFAIQGNGRAKVLPIYLPLVLGDFVAAPDLVVETVGFSSNNITVVIRNVGNSAVEDPFWVEGYLNPQIVPTGVNQRWREESNSQGGTVWGLTVDNGGLPLAPGESRTLTLNDAYYVANVSDLSQIRGGETYYVQVDAHNNIPGNTTGAIVENHERTGGVYNNIDGPRLLPDSFKATVSTTAVSSSSTVRLPTR